MKPGHQELLLARPHLIAAESSLNPIKQLTCRVPRDEGARDEGLAVSDFPAPLLLANNLLQPRLSYEQFVSQ